MYVNGLRVYLRNIRTNYTDSDALWLLRIELRQSGLSAECVLVLQYLIGSI
jgi:hypothetical protein